MGKLIVIEGTDGSGKSTQFSLLAKRLEQEGKAYRRIVFPRYSEPSSALIRMYLGGKFGGSPDDVNAYAASTFYAVDRFASFRMDWGEWYSSGGLVIADRYTTSNAVHQAAKLPEESREAFWQWLYDFEYGKLGLPQPSLVLYLDVPTGYTEHLLRHREESTNTHADIHERNTEYLAACRRAGRSAAAYSGWTVVQCVREGAMRSIEDIHEEIYRYTAACMEE